MKSLPAEEFWFEYENRLSRFASKKTYLCAGVQGIVTKNVCLIHGEKQIFEK